MRRANPVLVAVTVLVYLFLLGPLVVVLGAAVSTTTYLAFPPRGLTLHWFANALAETAFRQSFLVSLALACLGTAIALLLGIPAAYAMRRHRGRLPRALPTLFVLPILVPEIVFGFSLLKSLSVGLELPVFPTLLIGHVLLVLPYCIRVVGASLEGFDLGIEEAAISLGASPLASFLTVVLPNIRSGIVGAFVLAFITSLNDVSVSVFLTGPGISTLPIQILAYVEQFFDPTVAALSVLLMLLTAAVMLVVERSLGLTQLAR